MSQDDTPEMTEKEKAQLAEIRTALEADEVRFELTWAIVLGGGEAPGDGLRVQYRDYGQKRWSMVKTAWFPHPHQTTEDVFHMAMEIRRDVRAKRLARG